MSGGPLEDGPLLFRSQSLFLHSQVERIVDKRKNKKGKWEYLIRWKGYGSTEDTWEPEHHLLHCEEFIDEFNGLHVSKDKRVKSGKQAGASKLLRDTRSPPVERLSHRPLEPGKSKSTSHKRKRVNSPLSRPKKGSSGKAPGAGDRATKTVSYRTTPSGLQIMPLKKTQNGLENGDTGSEKDELHFENGSRQPDLELNDQVGEPDTSDCDGTHSALVENGVGLWLFLLSGLGFGWWPAVLLLVEIQSYVAQVGLQLTKYSRMALTSLSPASIS